MSSHKLPNYLRAYRKRAGLSQEEVAFLLGVRSGAKVCRYERLGRQPRLRTVIAYEIIFRATGRELFGGLYQTVEREVAARAAVLRYKLTRGNQDRVTTRKLETIKALAPEKKP